MEMFTLEELGLICIFDTSSRDKLMEELRDSLLDTEDEDIAALTRQALDKLEAMTDAEYDAIEFGPDYDYDEEMEE